MQQAISGDRTQFIHLRVRNNGIASDKGGYTVAVARRSNGLFSVTICQCNTNQRYDERLGQKIAETRLGRGQFFVQDRKQLEDTLHLLHTKLCHGNVPRLNLDVLDADVEGMTEQ